MGGIWVAVKEKMAKKRVVRELEGGLFLLACLKGLFMVYEKKLVKAWRVS
jgi:hypothetical protein